MTPEERFALHLTTDTMKDEVAQHIEYAGNQAQQFLLGLNPDEHPEAGKAVSNIIGHLSLVKEWLTVLGDRNGEFYQKAVYD